MSAASSPDVWVRSADGQDRCEQLTEGIAIKPVLIGHGRDISMPIHSGRG